MHQFLRVASCPIAGHHREEPGSIILLALLLQLLMGNDEVPSSVSAGGNGVFQAD